MCGNKVECCFDKVDNVACCFDIVAGVDGASQVIIGVFTGIPVGRGILL